MWIFFAIGSVFSDAMQTTVDKIAIVKNKTIDSLSATFLRVVMFELLFGFLGISALAGSLRVFLPLPIIGIGILCAGSAFFFTYFLKHIEATASSVISYATPVLYLLVDSFIAKAHLSAWQAMGIVLMACGGMMFVVNPQKFRLKKELTSLVWAMLGYNLLAGGTEYYGFKYYYSHFHLNEVSFGFSVWLVAAVTLFTIILLLGKLKTLRLTIAQRPDFLGAIFISKTFDATQWWLWLHALALASVSQVNAISSLYPLMLIMLLYLAQKTFKFKAEEKFSQGHLSFKLAAVVLLFLGGIFIG